MASGEGRPRGAELTETSQGALVPGPELWQENAGLPWLVGPNALLSPAMHWAEAEGAQLQRETKAFLTDEQRVPRGWGSQAWDGGVRELLSNRLGTKCKHLCPKLTLSLLLHPA